MVANVFTPIVKEHGVSNFRRVGHSFTNYFSSIDRSSFGFSSTSQKVVEQTANFAGTAGAVGGTLTLAMGEAAVAGLAGAGFLAAVAGPQVAVTAGVVGLALLIKGTYSNREAAHISLGQYVWNMVDTEPPAKLLNTAENINDACDAAMTLLDDGKSQVKLLGSKLGAASAKLEIFHTSLKAKIRILDAEVTKYRGAVAGARGKSVRDAAQKKYSRTRVEIIAEMEEAMAQGGAIYEYVRRCAHTGNYIQAAHIVSLAMKEKLKAGSVTSVAQTDYFAGFQLAIDSRRLFAELEVAYKKAHTLLRNA